jgi:hypothetical protein
MSPAEQRGRSQENAQGDLRKSMRHLLADIHEELERSDRSPLENMVHANKRIASLFVRAADSADRQSRIMINLTWAIVALTVVLVILTIVMLKK